MTGSRSSYYCNTTVDFVLFQPWAAVWLKAWKPLLAHAVSRQAYRQYIPAGWGEKNQCGPCLMDQGSFAASGRPLYLAVTSMGTAVKKTALKNFPTRARQALLVVDLDGDFLIGAC